MNTEIAKQETYRGILITITRLVTPFGGYLSALAGGTEVRRGPMLTVDDALALAKQWVDEQIAETEHAECQAAPTSLIKYAIECATPAVVPGAECAHCNGAGFIAETAPADLVRKSGFTPAQLEQQIAEFAEFVRGSYLDGMAAEVGPVGDASNFLQTCSEVYWDIVADEKVTKS